MGEALTKRTEVDNDEIWLPAPLGGLVVTGTISKAPDSLAEIGGARGTWRRSFT